MQWVSTMLYNAISVVFLCTPNKCLQNLETFFLPHLTPLLIHVPIFLVKIIKLI